MYKIDLNCDLGESFGHYKIGQDEKVISLITSANVACGYHASDPVVMKNTVEMAKKSGIHVGAHTGFPDLMGFGRRNMTVSLEEAKAYTMYQMGALMGFLQAEGMKMSHVKPHGAFYNMAAKDYHMACAICEGIKAVDEEVALMGLAGSELIHAAKTVGIPYIQEVFADRAYEEDGTLVARSKKGAMIESETEAIERVIRMVKEHKVQAITGKDVEIIPDSVCVHGDGEKALNFVVKIREALQKEGILIEAR